MSLLTYCYYTLLILFLQPHIFSIQKIQAITVQPAPFLKPRCVLIAANVSGLLMNRRLYPPDRLVYAFYPDESNSFDIFYHFHAHLRKNTRLESQLFRLCDSLFGHIDRADFSA